ADALEAEGLLLASLAENSKSILCETLSEAASVSNPVDMLATATPQQYAGSLRILLADENVDAVLLILPPPPMFSAGAVARQVLPIIQTAEKPVVIALMGHSLIQEAQVHFRAVDIPVYPFPERAAAALAALARRADYLAQEQQEPAPPEGINPEKARRLLATAEPGWLSQELAHGLLEAYGIPTPAAALARTAAEAKAIAQEIGFPVVLKIVSPQITHKSDVGGVVLDLVDGEAVTSAFAAMVARTRAAHQGAEIAGVLVQRMIKGGQEVIAGVTRDAQFGPLVMFGSGGVEVEGLEDVAFALAPLTEAAAQRLLHETWAGKKLAGHRDIPPADRAGALDILIRLGQLACDLPQLVEIEINPLLVLGAGVSAVDVRARLA
ncbi:MAG: acetate--CoA ligase family protein, partial [Anaerolineaceae bacterium]